MALVEKAYSFRELPPAPALRLLRNSFLLVRSSTVRCWARLRHAVTEAAEADGGKESAGEAMAEKRCHLHQRRARTPKAPSVRHEFHLDEEADTKFMLEALCEARKAAAGGEVPVGAVLVSQGRIIARAHNRVERENDPTAHAEMICIRNTARYLGAWRLLDSTLYVTLEPCPMCAGALLQARVNTVVWGAQNTLLGADGSWISLFPRQSLAASNGNQISDSKPNERGENRGPVHPFNPDIRVRRGILASDCSEVITNFFRQRRKESKKAKEIVPAYSLVSRLISAIKKFIYMALALIKHVGLNRSSLQ